MNPRSFPLQVTAAFTGHVALGSCQLYLNHLLIDPTFPNDFPNDFQERLRSSLGVVQVTSQWSAKMAFSAMAILGTAVGRSAGGLSRILADHGRHGSVGLLTRGTAPYSSSSVSAEPREEMPYDVCIVGAGPAGLAAAIRIKQLRGDDTTVCVLEKGAEVGAHSISGNVFDPRALDELLPDWKEREGVPVRQRVTSDRSYFLRSSGGAWPLPTPPTMKNEGKAFVISLSQLTRWLSEIAEESGVDVFPGFSASEVLYNEEKDEGGLDEVMGVATADMGYAKDGTRKDTFERGIELKARCTLFAEGCR